MKVLSVIFTAILLFVATSVSCFGDLDYDAKNCKDKTADYMAEKVGEHYYCVAYYRPALCEAAKLLVAKAKKLMDNACASKPDKPPKDDSGSSEIKTCDDARGLVTKLQGQVQRDCADGTFSTYCQRSTAALKRAFSTRDRLCKDDPFE